MFHISDVMKLHASEKVLAVVRAHSSALVARLSGFALFIVLPCFFIFPLFHLGAVGIGIFLLPVVIGGLGAWRAVRLWDATALVLTDHRLVHIAQSGLWDRHVSEVAFSHVGDIQWEKRGFWRSLWNIGTLRIRTNAGSIPSVVMADLYRPERLAQTLQELRTHGTQTHQSVAEGVPAKSSIEVRRERVVHAVEQATEEELEAFEETIEDLTRA